MLLPVHRDCTACELHANSRNPGLATRAHKDNRGRDTALLILGKAPAYEEDTADAPFSGPAGLYCDRVYIRAHHLTDYADVYLQNVVRCRLPHPDMAVPASGAGPCSGHLVEDLRALCGEYKEVVVLAVGPDAAKLLTGAKQNFNTFTQGAEVTWRGFTFRVFASYNPAILRVGKDPSKVLAIQDHLALLVDYLRHKELRYQLKDFPYRKGEPLPEVIDDGLLSLDTETYGYFHGYPTQRFFNPAKSLALDSVPREDLVLVGSVACRTKGELWACSYDLKSSKDLSIWSAIQARLSPSSSERLTLLGQNIPFDLGMLRAWSSEWRDTLSPYTIGVEDLMAWNFLENDQRPERSLKPLAKLLGITNYDRELNLKKGERYDSSSDPRVHAYAAKDALATLVAREVLRGRIATRFGHDSPKLSTYSQVWFSNLIWLCTELGESGITYNREGLLASMENLNRRVGLLRSLLAEKHGLILAGKGSPASKSEFVLRCFQELDLPVAPKLTKVRKEVAADDENLGVILDNGDPRAPLYKVAKLWGRHSTMSKLLSSYYQPLLGVKVEKKATKPTKPSKKNPAGKPGSPAVMDLSGALVDDTAYPTWYPVPSYYSLAGKDKQGGTKQARIVAQNHGAQTEPSVIWRTMTSRYGREGMVVLRDGSQIELRVGGALSGDPEMLAVYTAGRNFHAESATVLFGFDVNQGNKSQYPMHYHAGKTANFLRLFGGKAPKLRQTILIECKIDLPLLECEAFLDSDKAVFSRFYGWQQELLDRAAKYGFLETPLVGISRSFIGTRAVLEQTYFPDICNVLVQAVAAQLIQSAQIALQKEARAEGRRVHLTKNVYDAGAYDLHASEYDWWLARSEALYDNPPHLAALKAAGVWGSMPLASETKIVYNGPRT